MGCPSRLLGVACKATKDAHIVHFGSTETTDGGTLTVTWSHAPKVA